VAKVYFCDSPPGGSDPFEPLVWKNTNLLLDRGYRGIKTGITKTAGGCLASLWEGEDSDYIIVVLGCSGQATRFSDTELLREIYLNY
jgi:D-alanyl-D-alanine carboxypeptidase